MARCLSIAKLLHLLRGAVVLSFHFSGTTRGTSLRYLSALLIECFLESWRRAAPPTTREDLASALTPSSRGQSALAEPQKA